MAFKDMDLEKLWELFPMKFVDNTDNFSNIYFAEEKKLKFLLGSYIERISLLLKT